MGRISSHVGRSTSVGRLNRGHLPTISPVIISDLRQAISECLLEVEQQRVVFWNNLYPSPYRSSRFGNACTYFPAVGRAMIGFRKLLRLTSPN